MIKFSQNQSKHYLDNPSYLIIVISLELDLIDYLKSSCFHVGLPRQNVKEAEVMRSPRAGQIW